MKHSMRQTDEHANEETRKVQYKRKQNNVIKNTEIQTNGKPNKTTIT